MQILSRLNTPPFGGYLNTWSISTSKYSYYDRMRKVDLDVCFGDL